jgi:hypothetical protein
MTAAARADAKEKFDRWPEAHQAVGNCVLHARSSGANSRATEISCRRVEVDS